jgi:hypothetical protein
LAGALDQITSVKYEAAKEIAEHKVIEHGLPQEAAKPTDAASTDKQDELTDFLVRAGGEELLEYAKKLRDEGFTTIEALKNLEEDDFDALGITKRGHRKVMLSAVNNLKAAKATA